MGYKIIEQLGRAGNAKNREFKRAQWNLKYGEDNWEVMYSYGDRIMTREEALDDFYNESYYLYLKKNPHIIKTLCDTAKELYNPHAVNTGGVDLQCPAVLKALEKLNVELHGTERIAIGTWGKGIVYPNISYKLSPFKIPLWIDESISIEKFWQDFKYLAVKE